MEKIILDGTKFVDIDTTHKILKEVFEFPDYYGKNLYALWDCLTDWYLDDNAQIVWINFDKSKGIFRRRCKHYVENFQTCSGRIRRFYN